jgi:drug/metabolite transporter (DMT)-like permease
VYSTGDLRHVYEYVDVSSKRGGHQHTRVPDLLQLRAAQPHLHELHHLQVRLQGLGQDGAQRLVALYHPGLPRRRRQLLCRASLQLRTSPYEPHSNQPIPISHPTNIVYQTTILSAQLINFWAIVIVVIISFLFLKVRYHWTQILGILLAIGGVGVLFGSDKLTGYNAFPASNQVKGDLFALLGATFYGLSNVLEEYLVSERPLYEVVGQLAFWAMPINGVQAGIFDRASFRSATWNSKVGGYLTGYTFILSLFYSGAPVLFRLTSAAFFNISLLTGNFWGVAIGIEVFHLRIHWMYPIAFVLILLGQVIYFLRMGRLAEAIKPWLGVGQERGHAGLGTAKRRVERPGVVV